MVETKRKPALQPQMTTELVTSVTGCPVDVSVVIPCLNEANSIGICVEKAQKAFKHAGLRGTVGIGDPHCGMRGFTREVFDRMDLRSSGMEFASEFVIKAAQVGAKATEIPITLWKDKRGRPPHLRSFRDGWRHTRFMLLYAPNWLFILPGGLLMAAGLFLTSWLLPGPRKIPHNIVLDVHTMIFGVIFTLMGAQILAIGAFAKVFSYSERFDHNTVSLKRVLKRVTFES